MKQWEYLFAEALNSFLSPLDELSINGKDGDHQYWTTFKTLGEQGWELVSIDWVNDTACFKRLLVGRIDND